MTAQGSTLLLCLAAMLGFFSACSAAPPPYLGPSYQPTFEEEKVAPTPPSESSPEAETDSETAAPEFERGPDFAEGLPFRVAFPAGLTILASSQEVNSVQGKLTLENRVAKGPTQTFALVYNDFAEDLSSYQAAEEALLGAKVGAASQSGGKLSNEQLWDLPNADRAVTFDLEEASGDARKHWRFGLAVVGKRLYRVYVVGPKDSFDTAAAQAFLASFEIVD